MTTEHATELDWDKFCRVVEEFGTFTKACRLLGIRPSQLDKMRKADPELNDRVEDALQAYRDNLEAEALRRGVEGVEKPIYQQGQFVGGETVYSDKLLEILLKKNIPEYRNTTPTTNIATGGVLLIPAAPAMSEDWEDSYANKNKTK